MMSKVTLKGIILKNKKKGWEKEKKIVKIMQKTLRKDISFQQKNPGGCEYHCIYSDTFFSL